MSIQNSRQKGGDKVMMYGSRFKGDKLIGGSLDFKDGKTIRLNAEQNKEFESFIQRKIEENKFREELKKEDEFNLKYFGNVDGG